MVNVYVPGMDKERAAVKKLIDQRELKLGKLSLLCGRSHSYFSEYFSKQSPKRLPLDVREIMGKEYGIDPDRLRYGELVPTGVVTPSPTSLEIAGPIAEYALEFCRTAVSEDGKPALALHLQGGKTIVVAVDLEVFEQLKNATIRIEKLLLNR